MSSILKFMSEDTYSKYMEDAIPSYAHENIKSGRWPEERAIERSREDHKKLLPDGIQTKNNHFFEIRSVDNDHSVGYLWIAIEDNFGSRSAFIYDIAISKEHRRQGYAKRALKDLEKFVKDQNINSLSLHVFRQNSAAQSLYTALGYKVVSTNMVKVIDVTP
jgi:ribosomal protein S18 acetylase RimI-like enzyme